MTSESSDLDSSSTSIEVGRLSTGSAKSASKARRDSNTTASNKKQKVEKTDAASTQVAASDETAMVVVEPAQPAEVEVRRMIRSVPPLLKSRDPAQCLDMIDNMYNIYYELEVCHR
jgi:hypothetical protein